VEESRSSVAPLGAFVMLHISMHYSTCTVSYIRQKSRMKMDFMSPLAVLSIATFFLLLYFFITNTDIGFILSVSVLMCNALRTLSNAVPHGCGAGRV